MADQIQPMPRGMSPEEFRFREQLRQRQEADRAAQTIGGGPAGTPGAPTGSPAPEEDVAGAPSPEEAEPEAPPPPPPPPAAPGGLPAKLPIGGATGNLHKLPIKFGLGCGCAPIGFIWGIVSLLRKLFKR